MKKKISTFEMCRSAILPPIVKMEFYRYDTFEQP